MRSFSSSSGTVSSLLRWQDDCATAYDIATLSLADCFSQRVARTFGLGMCVPGAGKASANTYRLPLEQRLKGGEGGGPVAQSGLTARSCAQCGTGLLRRRRCGGVRSRIEQS